MRYYLMTLTQNSSIQTVILLNDANKRGRPRGATRRAAPVTPEVAKRKVSPNESVVPNFKHCVKTRNLRAKDKNALTGAETHRRNRRRNVTVTDSDLENEFGDHMSAFSWATCTNCNRRLMVHPGDFVGGSVRSA